MARGKTEATPEVSPSPGPVLLPCGECVANHGIPETATNIGCEHGAYVVATPKPAATSTPPADEPPPVV